MKTQYFRILEASDIHLLQQALALAARWREAPAHIGNAPSDLLYIIDDWGTRAGDLAMGMFDRDSDEILAVAWLRYWSEIEHSYGFVSPEIPELGMAVFPSHRGRGFGTRLLRSVQGELIARSALVSPDGNPLPAALSLSVEKANSRARSLYERSGFTLAEEREGDRIMKWEAPVRLEPFKTLHIEAMQRLWAATDGVMYAGDREDSAPQLQAFLERNPGLSFVALKCADSSLVGGLLCGYDGRRGYVHHLAVEASFRNSGAASALLAAAGLSLGRLGVRRMHLFVLGDNLPARDFYTQRGWRYRDDIALFSRDISL